MTRLDDDDEVMRAVARELVATVRDTDLVARLGDDQFAILLGRADHGGADRIRGNVAAPLTPLVSTQ